MNTGTIKFFNVGKGFGFVTPDGGGADIFLPAATVAAVDAASVKPGQRVSFEQAPDTKGPKVVSLKLLDEILASVPSPAEQVTVYGHADADITADVVDAVQDSGFAPTTHDFMAVPPTVEQLKWLSQLLNVSDQSLVRRYDPLFLALQLDDRFISDQDFWTGIVEHPALIKGPILELAGRARICETADEAHAFLRNDDSASPPKAKRLSARLAALLRGEALPAVEHVAPAETPVAPDGPEQSPGPKPRRAAEPLVKPKLPDESKLPAEPKLPAKPKREASAKAGPAKAIKEKAPAKKAAKPAEAKTRARK